MFGADKIMRHLTANTARKEFDAVLDDVARFHEPVNVAVVNQLCYITNAKDVRIWLKPIPFT